MSSTKAIESEYNGRKFLAIMPVDDNGELGKKQIIGFGLVKAEAILDHLDDIKEWVASQPNKRKTNEE